MNAKYDGIPHAEACWVEMSNDDRQALMGRWQAWQRGDRSQVTFRDAEILCYLADREL